MQPILSAILILFTATYAVASKPVQLLDITEQQGAITAHFKLTGTTISESSTGNPTISTVDRLEAILQVDVPDDYTVAMPTFTGATFGDFTLVDQGRTERIRQQKHTTTRISWLIEPYNTGSYEFPPLTLSATSGATTENLTLKLPPLTVSNTTKAETPFDILPARKIPAPLPWRMIVLVSGGVALIILCIFVFKENKRPRPLSPKQLALKRLATLKDQHQEEMGQLSHIIRQFLDQNFTLTTSEKTYPEYESFIKKHPQILKTETILSILHTCDLANYAGKEISQEQWFDLLHATRNWLHHSPEPLRPDEDPGTCGKW